MKILLFIARVVTGMVFVFSGFVKAVDPLGSAIKFEEYFMAFHLDFLIFAALPLAIALSAAEFMIGINLLAGLCNRFTAWLLMIFMSFFTILTFLSALSNPVSDCGCFGDALKLTNWQTFWKNIILLAPAFLVFFYRNKPVRKGIPLIEPVLSSTIFLLGAGLSAYCIRHQPLLDFRPYEVGTSIPDEMSIPAGAPADLYETVLVYQKDGVMQEFTENNFPWQDTAWKWVETRQTLIKKGYEPPIHDFSVTTEDGFDITESILGDSSYTFLIIAPDLQKTSAAGMNRMNDLALKAAGFGFKVYCLTASAEEPVRRFKETFRPVFPVCTTDETTLKTIMRANPGLLILREGIVLGKWNHHDIPQLKDIHSGLLSSLLDQTRKNQERLIVAVTALGILLFVSMVSLFRSRQG